MARYIICYGKSRELDDFPIEEHGFGNSLEVAWDHHWVRFPWVMNQEWLHSLTLSSEGNYDCTHHPGSENA